MPAVVFAIPGPLDAATGGTTYDRRIVEGRGHDRKQAALGPDFENRADRLHDSLR